MAQLQGIVTEIAASPKTSQRAEVIKPGVQSLPSLPDLGAESCLLFSDWLHNVRPALADVSDNSEELWSMVVSEATEWYKVYLKLDPLGVGVADTIDLMRRWKRWCNRMSELGGDAPSGKVPCTFYVQNNGCKKGADCAFEHNWNSFSKEEKSQRCKVYQLITAQWFKKDLECQIEHLQSSPDPTQTLKKFIATGDRGDALQALIAQSRAARRALLQSDRWVVHLCSGAPKRNDPLANWCKEQGLSFLPVDIREVGGKGWDLTKRDGVWRVLLWAAAAGRISGIFSSPPLHADPSKEVLKYQDKFLWSLASVANGQGIPFLSEVSGIKEGPVTKFNQWSGMELVVFYQGSLGDSYARPTRISTNLEMGFLARLPMKGSLENPKQGTTCEALDAMIRSARQGEKDFAVMQEAAAIEEERLNRMFEQESDMSSSDEEGGDDEAPEVKEIKEFSPAELERWRQHVLNGHVPYRKDCRQCVEGAGLGPFHAKVRHPRSYTLSLDLFGPVPPPEAGRDESCVTGKCVMRYGLIGALRVPKSVLPAEPKEIGIEDLVRPSLPKEGAVPDDARDSLYEPSEPGDDLFPELEIDDGGSREIEVTEKDRGVIQAFESLESDLDVEPLDKEALQALAEEEEAPLGDSLDLGPQPEEEDVKVPDRRVRGKSKVRFLDASDGESSLEELAAELLLDDDVSDQAFRKIVCLLENQEKPSGDRRGGVDEKYVLGRSLDEEYALHAMLMQSVWDEEEDVLPPGYPIDAMNSVFLGRSRADDGSNSEGEDQCVETILESLTDTLKVVHNVSPDEVRKHLEKWIPAAKAEVVLPAKTVFTVKPGAEKDPGLELYAGGVPAEALRTILVEAAVRREWVKEAPELEEGFAVETLRRAQRITGELLWLTQRTRVDAAYTVSLMGSWCSKAPEHVIRLGKRLLHFLGSTKDWKLSLIPVEGEKRVVVYTDASFAPYGSHSITGVLVSYHGRSVAWKAKKQALVSLSTAESELIAACEGVVMGQSSESLILELTDDLRTKLLLVDNLVSNSWLIC
ncbi:RXLR161 [Symbiodinium sp. CCMP2592]|nr:RXLR161 [Symbiodinium sp. CCMP2592]